MRRATPRRGGGRKGEGGGEKLLSCFGMSVSLEGHERVIEKTIKTRCWRENEWQAEFLSKGLIIFEQSLIIRFLFFFPP